MKLDKNLIMVYSGFIISVFGLANVLWVLKSEAINSKPLSIHFLDFTLLIIGIIIVSIPILQERRVIKQPSRHGVEQ